MEGRVLRLMERSAACHVHSGIVLKKSVQAVLCCARAFRWGWKGRDSADLGVR